MMCSFFSIPLIRSSKAARLISFVISRTRETLTSASINALCSSFTMESTRFLSRKMAFAILSVVFFNEEDSFSNIKMLVREGLIKLWFSYGG